MRFVFALLVAGALAIGALLALRPAPAPPPTPGPADTTPTPDDPPPAIPDDDPPVERGPSAAEFHAADDAKRRAMIEELFANRDVPAILDQVGVWLAPFEPGKERSSLETIVEILFEELAAELEADPDVFEAVAALLEKTANEPQRLVVVRLLQDAYTSEIRPAPPTEILSDLYESSEHPVVRRVILEDIGLLHDFEGAQRLIEDALLGKTRDADIEAAVLAIETVIDEQRRIRADLNDRLALHSAIAGRYRHADQVPDSTADFRAALQYAGLRGPQQRETFEEIVDLLVLLRGRDELGALAERAEPPTLRGIASKAHRSVRPRSNRN